MCTILQHSELQRAVTLTELAPSPYVSIIKVHLADIKVFEKFDEFQLLPFQDTGDSRYVDFVYLDTITYVEVIFHSQHFFSIYLCISTSSMLKMVNMKQRVSRGDFSCPRRIFYYICYCLCQSQKSALARAPYCLLQQCICIT